MNFVSDSVPQKHHFGGHYTRALVWHLQDKLGPDGRARVLAAAGESRSLEVLTDQASWTS